MKCCYCGADISEAERFCRYCGTKQSAPQPEPTPVKPVPAPPVEEPVKRRGAFEQPRGTFEQPQNSYRVSPAPKPAPQPAPQPIPQPIPQPVPQPAPVQSPYAVNVSVATPPAPKPERPRIQLPTERAWWKMILLGMVTFSIYPIVIWNKIVTELNIAASRHDGERTMSYMAMWSLAPITLFIYPIIWQHNFCARIGRELYRRNLNYKFGAADMWLWGVLGSFIFVGPFIFCHKLMKSMNLINADFNEKG